MTSYYEFYSRARATYQPAARDTVEWTDGIAVTEEEVSEDTMRRYMEAQDRLTLEMMP